jgi:chaperonin GroES
MTRDLNRYPPGLNRKEVEAIIAHYDQQTPEEAVAEDEAEWLEQQRKTSLNLSARLTLVSGQRVVLRETLVGEQVRLPNGNFAAAVTPMKNGRFRLWQTKVGEDGIPVRSPIDLTAQHVEKLKRSGATNGLGPMPGPLAKGEHFEIIQLGLSFAGRIESFNGRLAVTGTCEKSGQERAIALVEIQVLEVSRRKPPPRVRPVEEVIENEGEPETRDTQEDQEKEISAVSVKPTEDRVLVKPIEAETKTASGIYLPETAKEKPVKGEVIATGPGKRLDNGKRAEMSVSKGDTVVYGKYAGTEVEIKGVKHLIIRESELLGVIEG